MLISEGHRMWNTSGTGAYLLLMRYHASLCFLTQNKLPSTRYLQGKLGDACHGAETRPEKY